MFFAAFAGFVLACSAGGAAPANPQEPSATIGARDVVAEFKLPPLLDGPNDTVWRDDQTVQVLTRAKMLNVNEGTATQAWALAQSALAEMQSCSGAAQAPPVEFRGGAASQLNELLARGNVSSVRVTSSQLLVDTPILLNRDGIDLDLEHTELVGMPPGSYMVRIEGAKNINVRGGLFATGQWGMLVAGSSHVTVERTTMRGLMGGGIVITGSNDVTVTRSLFEGLGGAPVLLHGNTQAAKIVSNQMLGNVGASNWAAGVVLTDLNADLAANPQNLFANNGYGPVAEPIASLLSVPENNLIAYNRIAGNLSSGIYSDGSIGNVFYANSVENNAKEGMCLDNGSSGDVVAFNLFRANGKRWGQSDADLEFDYVLSYGRLPDGTSPAKLPGISIDNAAYNEVVFNNVDENYGSGIKMVRTAFYNLIGVNTVTDNNAGVNDLFHFFGIELGFAGPDAPDPDLDFTPSRGNEIFGNNIRGAHYSGIFFAQGSDQNNLFDNTIFYATDWGMESAIVQANITLNNLTNLPLRNIGSGLNPPFTASQ